MSTVNSVNTESLYTNKLNANTRKTSGMDLGMTDFLSLISAQLQNQDMFNPMNDTDFIASLAQFSSLQSLENMMTLTSTSYATSLVGKEVTVARMDGGIMVTNTGTVSGIGLFENEPIIYVDGIQYTLSEIMVIGNTEKTNTGNSETDDSGTGASDEDGTNGSE